MRKFLVLLAMVLIVISASDTRAASFDSEEGVKAMVDVKFQMHKTIEVCYEAYGNTEEGKACAKTNIIAYRDFYQLVQTMAHFSQDPGMANDLEFQAMENCVAGVMSSLWISKLNTAPWLLVNQSIAACFDKIDR